MVVPGNHDHHLLEEWLERRRLDGAKLLELEQRVPVESGPLAQLVRGTGLERIELAYPGVWLRAGVYATHGHFLDRHLTVPTFERLAVAAVERVLAGSKDAASAERLAAFEAGAASPDDYERAQAPVYAFLFSLAQAGTTSERLGGSNPSARVWQALGGGYGRAARLRGWLLGTVAVPGAVGVANRLGLGPVRSDLSPGAVTRAGLAAIGEVDHKLGIEADHLIFGHTHRRGPMRGEQRVAPRERHAPMEHRQLGLRPGDAGPHSRREPLLARDGDRRSRASGSRSSGTCSTSSPRKSSPTDR